MKCSSSKNLLKKIGFLNAGSLTVFLLLAMLVSPDIVFTGAADGLLLWFNTIFPTLFPFMFITAILLKSGGLNIIANVLGKPLGKIFSVSAAGAFSVIAGFLCGYPMGAKVTADLVCTKKIERSEAAYLLSFCNNTSPVFIVNFIIHKILRDRTLLVPTLIILIAVPIFLSFFFRRFYFKHSESYGESLRQTECKNNPFSFRTFDECMMDSFENIVKVGGYIIIFSVFIRLLTNFSTDIPAFFYLLPVLELTNGIIILFERFENIAVSYPLIIALTSFGGLCALAQTKSMIHSSGIPFIPYLIQKIITAVISAAVAYGYVLLFL